ncbi:PD-(D/E)XK nuclease superfamily protein [Caballeronia arvi]|uniref:PD-(D/E)XK nuclease superfamily protein n=1 Tax=Caballeronia arvi TaxID=1777135 RepID=A0A158HTD9_9BURK|nr:DUF2800 domain-containing protein [Caballeronia arvi]SAL47181.1 PD-(D/E)XK nuclease superfamily protein [Caballeronia arvi]
MSTQTEERAHALLSPSSAYTWISCKASTAAQLGQPDDSSEYADEGTAAHELAKWCLEGGTDTTAYIGRIIPVGEREFEVDDEMAGFVQTYVDGVRDRVAAYELAGATVEMLVEQRLSIEHITGEKGAKGTSDCVLIASWPTRAEICVIDLKYGRGVAVLAEGNYQGMLYAGGAVEEHGAFHDFDTVVIVIHQPRLSETPSEWSQPIDSLLGWLDTVAKPAAETAMLYVDSVELAPLALADFNPGEKQCKFCKAKAVCPALMAHVETTLAADFTSFDISPEHRAPLKIELLDNDALGRVYESLDLIDGWMKAVRGRIEVELLAGNAVPGTKLVAGRRGARKWSSTDEAEALLKSMRLKQDEMYTFKVISPTQAEKLLAKESPRRWKKVESLVTQADGKPSVAPEHDKRPALVIEPVVDEFEAVTTEDDGGDLV